MYYMSTSESAWVAQIGTAPSAILTNNQSGDARYGLGG